MKVPDRIMCNSILWYIGNISAKWCVWIGIMTWGGLSGVKAQPVSDSIQLIKFYKGIIYTLAHDSLKGRPVGSREERIAAGYIQQQWKQIKGFKPKLHNFSFRPNDTASVFMPTQNVYCFINNKADSTIVISAHYEHIGLGGSLSFAYSKRNQIHNGADDNASGIALLLGLSKTFRQWQNKQYNYLFVAYSAHEVGLFGSTAFSDFIRFTFPPVKKVFNFDMVGRLDKTLPAMNIYGVGTLPTQEAKQIKQLRTGIKLFPSFDETILNTDCRIFVKQNIRCLSFTTGVHDDYHKPDDDAEYINYEGIYTIQRILETYFLKQ